MAFVLFPSVHLINGSKFVINAPPPSCVRFRSSHRISAVLSTVGRNNSSRIAPSASLYEVLGIQMGATYHEIKTAYRSLARVLHPDVGSSNRRSELSGEEFMRIQAAYSILSDANKRADYDSQDVPDRFAVSKTGDFKDLLAPRAGDGRLISVGS